MKILQQDKGSIFGNTLFGTKDMDVRDRIAQKNHLYRKEALHVRSTANKGEQRLDKTVEDHRGRISYLMEENEKLLDSYQAYNRKMDQAKAEYDIKDDSQEQDDLEFLKKVHDVPLSALSEEERDRYEQLKDHMTDYQKFSMDCYKVAAGHKKQLESNQREMIAEAAAVRLISLTRLKQHAMVDAETAKENILNSASKEVQGMLVSQAQETLDQKTEQIKEEADQREEKQEEREEHIEDVKDRQTEAQAIAKEIHTKVEELSEQVTDSGQVMQDVKQVVQKVIQEQKLLEEELKGVMINLNV